MDKLETALEKAREQIKSLIKADMPKEQIDKIGAIDKILDEVKSEHESQSKEMSELKDGYIDLVKNSSTKTPPSSGEPSQEKTLDDIISDVIANRKK